MWEKIEVQRGGYIYAESSRIKVPGGWIVRTMVRESAHQIFVSDPRHEWELPEANQVPSSPSITV